MTASLSPGLEGIAVAETRLSQINGEQGELAIRGFPIDELASNARYEETVFLGVSSLRFWLFDFSRAGRVSG